LVYTKIAVFGLGKAGLPLALTIAENEFDVKGIDLDFDRCNLINNEENPIPEEPGLDEYLKKYGGSRLTASPNYNDARNCNVFIVLIPLLLNDEKNLELKNLESVFGDIASILKEGDIVVLETTVPPRTTETLVRQWLEEGSGMKMGDFYLAYSPERIMTGYSLSRLKEFPKIIGGVDDKSGRKSYSIYEKFIPNLSQVSSSRMAEFIKIIEGCYRDVNIALANELFKIANKLDLDFFEARKFANHDYCDIHLPSTGVGGHCIPVYPWFLIKQMEKINSYDDVKLLRSSREVNDQMVNYWAEELIKKSLKLNKPLAKVRFCVKGLTYRANVNEVYNSRNISLVKFLMEKGVDIYAYDDILEKQDVEKLGLKWLKPEDSDILFDSFNLTININQNKV
jgi:UDP-N-acetyl-D-mannosaminuronic acid dehydrogenase